MCSELSREFYEIGVSCLDIARRNKFDTSADSRFGGMCGVGEKSLCLRELKNSFSELLLVVRVIASH